MARIPEEELERIKREVSLVSLVAAYGVQLSGSGDNLMGRCPLRGHADETPSFIVSPSKGLWHCMGKCQTGGSVIDLVMKADGVSFRHAVEMLRTKVSSGSERPAVRSKLEALAESHEPDRVALSRVAAFYHDTFRGTAEGQAYLEKRGLHDREVFAALRLGYANRTLSYHLPEKRSKEGAAVHGQLQRLGVLRASGHEHLVGSLVVPVFSEDGEVLELYGRKIRDDLRKGTPMHLYLPRRPDGRRGVFNLAGLKASKDVVLAEALLDAITFLCAGIPNVTSAYGVEGFTGEMREAFLAQGIERVLIAYDRDEAGDRAAEKLAKELGKDGLSVFRVLFPKGMDANEYARKVQPARKSLEVAVRNAQWMAGARLVSVPDALMEPERRDPERSSAAEDAPAMQARPAQLGPAEASAPDLSHGPAEMLDELREPGLSPSPASRAEEWLVSPPVPVATEELATEAVLTLDLAHRPQVATVEAAKSSRRTEQPSLSATEACDLSQLPSVSATEACDLSHRPSSSTADACALSDGPVSSAAVSAEVPDLAHQPSMTAVESAKAGHQSHGPSSSAAAGTGVSHLAHRPSTAPGSVETGHLPHRPSSSTAEPAKACDPAHRPSLAASSPPATQRNEVEVSEDEVRMQLGDRRWRLRGLARATTYETLKVNVLVTRGDAFFVDTVELYSARQRSALLKATSAELGVDEGVLKSDLGKIVRQLEGLVHERMAASLAPKAAPVMTEAERDAALVLLRDPQLFDRILDDFDRAGVVGEETNKLLGYLAATSRKLEAPLAVVLQSSSAAGKSSLMEAVLRFMPEEERVEYSAMTGQSLFYMGETDLSHKILAVAEEQGVQSAEYALKLLQSEGRLRIASTGKDPASGKLVTHDYEVQGPVQIFLTTTAVEVDEELLNRCLVLTVDEGTRQTAAIHERQRDAQTLEGLLARRDRERVMKLHQNAQRLLEPLYVANPFAKSLRFPSHSTRARRDHMKYLTLIRAIALLHQHQRPVKEVEHGGERIRYVEVAKADIAVADQLMMGIARHDEMPPHTRALLEEIERFVGARARVQGVDASAVRFTRRELREHTKLSHTQLRIHMLRLEELEHLVAHGASGKRRFAYELVAGPAGAMEYDRAFEGGDGQLKGARRGLEGAAPLQENTSVSAGKRQLLSFEGAAAETRRAAPISRPSYPPGKLNGAGRGA